VTAVEEPSLSQVSIAPQPFSIAEFERRLYGGTAAELAWSKLCEDRFGPFAQKRCAMKALEARGMRAWP
jgi:hypothetical protein